MSSQSDQQKGFNAKMHKRYKKKKKYQTFNFFSSLVSLTRHFTKFIFLEQLAAMPQFSMQNMFFFVFFFEAVIMIRTLYFMCIIFIRKYSYILADINNESSRVIFSSFFCLHPVGQTFLWPSKFCYHLKHSAK